jgi:hypothetical protein
MTVITSRYCKPSNKLFVPGSPRPNVTRNGNQCGACLGLVVSINRAEVGAWFAKRQNRIAGEFKVIADGQEV